MSKRYRILNSAPSVDGKDQLLAPQTVVLASDYDALCEQSRVLREALEPFAERWEYFERVPPVNGKEWDYYHCYADEEPSFVYLGQLKAAKAALTATSQPGGTHEL